VRLFSVASARAPSRGRALLAFLSGYALVWTAFGAVAFADALAHRLIADNAGLRAHQSMVVAGVLALAGAAQFTPLKDRCLTECRHPGAFLMRHCRRGTRGSFMLGRRHGLFCLGGCWALTLVMFVAGVADLIFMGALTVLMVYEKTATRGAEGVPTAGSRCSHGRPSCSCTHTGFRRHSAGAADHHDRAAIATNTPILGEARPPARTTHRPSPLRFATSFGASREFLAHSRLGQGRDWCGGSSQLAGASQNGETRTQIGDTTIFRERREKALPAESLQLSTSNVAPSGRVAHGLGRLPARVRLRGGFEVPNDVVRMSDFHRTPLPPVGLRSR
jgi:hypothetical protein